MAVKKQIKIKRPNAATLRDAGRKMDETWYAFEASQLAFAILVFEAGNKELESFSFAMKELATERHNRGGKIGFSKSVIELLFRHIESKQ